MMNGYKVLEPLATLRKDALRKVAKLERITQRITALPNVNCGLHDLTPEPPATVEYG
jgi:GMP synthase PP-ATPase subunit